MSGKLYIVPTPVGNLADMSPRAVEVLKAADVILAEDTRTSKVLMDHFGITTPLVSHHKYNEHDTTDGVISRIMGGETVALVSDAGTPGISDPGFLLSRAARNSGVEVITLPGPTAFVPALVNSGLPCDRFTFEGFLPPKKGRRTRLEEIAAEPRTVIVYESPLKLLKTLGDLIEVCGGDRPVSVSREISKLHEQTVRGTLSEVLEHFTLNQPRGEMVIIIKGDDSANERRVHRNKYKDIDTEITNQH